MNYAPPSHVCDMKQTIYSTQINKNAIICNVLDITLDQCTFLEDVECFQTLFITINFQQYSTRKNNVSAFLVELQNLKIKIFSKQFIKITYWSQIHLRTGQESFDTNIYRKSALNSGYNSSTNNAVFFINITNFLPGAYLFGLAFREISYPVFICFECFHINFYRISNLYL